MAIIAQSEEVILLTSVARTVNYTSPDLQNLGGHSGLNVILDATNIGTGSVTLAINAKDLASGKYYNILTGVAITTNSTNRYKVSAYIASVANSIAQDELPPIFQIAITANNANAATYTVGYALVR